MCVTKFIYNAVYQIFCLLYSSKTKNYQFCNGTQSATWFSFYNYQLQLGLCDNEKSFITIIQLIIMIIMITMPVAMLYKIQQNIKLTHWFVWLWEGLFMTLKVISKRHLTDFLILLGFFTLTFLYVLYNIQWYL